jgi:hypothetical protein
MVRSCRVIVYDEARMKWTFRLSVISVISVMGLALVSCARSETPVPSEAARGTSSAAPGELRAPTSLRPEVANLDLAAAERALTEAERQLSDTVRAAAPDCEHARGLRDRICELAARICQLVEADPSAKNHCDDGRKRCSSASTKVATQCS